MNFIMKNTHKNGVSKKKEKKLNWMMKRKGQNIENPSNFKLDCPNSYKYSLVPLQLLFYEVNECVGLNFVLNFRRSAQLKFCVAYLSKYYPTFT